MSINSLQISLDRSARMPLSEQIRVTIAQAITSGVLAPGTRLPSWIDLAVQLGISRGTVKTAYERLGDAQLVTSSRAKGTCVAEFLPARSTVSQQPEPVPGSSLYQNFFLPTGDFQMGIPASDVFPVAIFSRLFSAAARKRMSALQLYTDPRGEAELKREIAAQLVLARGIKCHPSQIFITTGFTGALGVLLHALNIQGQKAWVENPGFPPARRALEMAQLSLVPVPVDEEGINVSYGVQHAKEAALALVTPGQQAPLGMTLSLERREQLLAWAATNQSWIIEDDYLGELQLNRRAAPALFSMDNAGRVIYVGTFSKTISPVLRLGFMVVPTVLVDTVADVVASLSPAPDPALQMAVQTFLHEGHFLRHLRKMKRTYSTRSAELVSELRALGYETSVKGLSVLLRLEHGTQDRLIAQHAGDYGLAPSPLSVWYCAGIPAQAGLLLGLATVEGEKTRQACQSLDGLIRRFSRQDK